jgi:hypothetical protein
MADAVPSTPMFEMYPVGLTSIADFLERNHYNVEASRGRRSSWSTIRGWAGWSARGGSSRCSKSAAPPTR